MKCKFLPILFVPAFLCVSCGYDDVPEEPDRSVYYADGDGSCPDAEIDNAHYCFEKEIKSRKESGESCLENYECSSKHCLNKVCL